MSGTGPKKAPSKTMIEADVFRFLESLMRVERREV